MWRIHTRPSNTETLGKAEEASNECKPCVFSFTDEATPSTSCDKTQGASSALGAYQTISDNAWPYQWNTQPRPITDGVTDNGSASYLHQRLSSSIDHATHSRNPTGMEQPPFITEGGARIPESTGVDQWNTQCHPAYGTSIVSGRGGKVFGHWYTKPCRQGHTDNTETGSTGFTLPVHGGSPVASTSCSRMEERSDIFGNDACIPDDAWQYQWNTPPTPITEVTHNIEGVPDHGITSYMQLGSLSSINQARPSTSRAGMEEASANFEGGATISESTMVHQGNTQHQLAESTSTVFGHTGMTETKSTGLALPVDSSSSGDYAVASTSRIGTEKASDSSGNDARLCDDSFEDLWDALNSHNDTSDVRGRTNVTESGVTSSPPMTSSSSVNHAQPSTSRAGMEEASAVPENISRNAPGTGRTEQRELCGACGNVSSRADALHGHAKEPTNDTAQICKACDQSSVKMSMSVELCHNFNVKKHKYEACGKQFRWACDLANHQPTHTDERRYKCEICEKMFRHASRLSNHRRTHRDEKPYLCITCGRTYKWPYDLRKHERTHAEANRHTCQKCAKSFENKYNLKRHLGTQCGNSAFICDICGRFFMIKSTLLRHRRTKHADKTPYDCTQCGCRFADQKTRDRHVCQMERRM